MVLWCPHPSTYTSTHAQVVLWCPQTPEDFQQAFRSGANGVMSGGSGPSVALARVWRGMPRADFPTVLRGFLDKNPGAPTPFEERDPPPRSAAAANYGGVDG